MSVDAPDHTTNSSSVKLTTNKQCKEKRYTIIFKLNHNLKDNMVESLVLMYLLLVLSPGVAVIFVVVAVIGVVMCVSVIFVCLFVWAAVIVVFSVEETELIKQHSRIANQLCNHHCRQGNCCCCLWR